MDQNIRISIVGCGWLGFPLAVRLADSGYIVRGSTTSGEKLAELARNKIDPFLVQFDPELLCDRAAEFFQSDVLIITIPPKKAPEKYLLQISEINRILMDTAIKRVIYISSTSVYRNDHKEVNENDEINPETESGKAICLAEKLLMSNPHFKTTVLRFGGLTGPGRDPARFLAGKTDLANGRAPINLIHLDDCIGLIQAILTRDVFGNVFNGCTPDHPTRRNFYTLAAEKAGLPVPSFKDELLDWKIVSSINTPTLLSYNYKVTNWMDWLRTGQL